MTRRITDEDMVRELATGWHSGPGPRNQLMINAPTFVKGTKRAVLWHRHRWAFVQWNDRQCGHITMWTWCGQMLHKFNARWKVGEVCQSCEEEATKAGEPASDALPVKAHNYSQSWCPLDQRIPDEEILRELMEGGGDD